LASGEPSVREQHTSQTCGKAAFNSRRCDARRVEPARIARHSRCLPFPMAQPRPLCRHAEVSCSIPDGHTGLRSDLLVTLPLLWAHKRFAFKKRSDPKSRTRLTKGEPE
jgi:hypothetical protein